MRKVELKMNFEKLKLLTDCGFCENSIKSIECSTKKLYFVFIRNFTKHPVCDYSAKQFDTQSLKIKLAFSTKENPTK